MNDDSFYDETGIIFKLSELTGAGWKRVPSQYLTIFHGRNKMSVIQKALVQLNLNLTVPKSSRSHFSFVQKHFQIFLTDTQF